MQQPTDVAATGQAQLPSAQAHGAG
jgi:hypothetical protein